MLKGDSEYAGQHKHGVQPGVAGTVEQSIPKRLTDLEARVAKLEADIFGESKAVELAPEEAEQVAEAQAEAIPGNDAPQA